MNSPEAVKEILPARRNTRRRGEAFRCSRCKEFKPRSEYTKKRSVPYGIDPYCRPCKRAYQNGNPDSAKASSLRRHYGLAREEYDRLFAEQGGLCAVCRRPEAKVHRGRVRMLSVDHDHRTGRVRGLLCYACNGALGLMRDDPALVGRALEYLRRHGSDQLSLAGADES